MKGPYKLWTGDCREVVGYGYAENTFDSIVTDPPYGLEFMDKAWDRGVPSVEFWAHALRVAKPGAYLLAFGGTRTYHRLTCAIEDAGWEIRDCIMWVYGSGFPKSHSIGKAIDKAAGAEREVVGMKDTGRALGGGWAYGDASGHEMVPVTVPATPEARQWEGWGTALKPAWEPIIVAQKPMKTTVAQNVLKHGTGGMHIDGCRIGTAEDMNPADFDDRKRSSPMFFGRVLRSYEGHNSTGQVPNGRWPANLIHDGSDEVVALFPTQAGGGFGVRGGRSSEQLGGLKATYEQVGFGDSGSAARFFYCAKASRKDREEGCEELGERAPDVCLAGRPDNKGQTGNPYSTTSPTPRRNIHSTVKPTALMRYLIRLVTQPGGLVLDPFLGSGSTGKAAMLEGMRFVGVDLNAEYVEIAKARIEHALATRTEPEEE